MYVAIEHIWNIESEGLSAVSQSVIGYANNLRDIEAMLQRKGYTQQFDTSWGKYFNTLVFTVSISEIPHVSLVR